MKVLSKILVYSFALLLLFSQVVLAEGSSQPQTLRVETDALNQPSGIVVSDSGRLLVADTYNNQIKEVQADGVVVIAGKTDKKDLLGFPLGAYVDGNVEEAYFNRPRSVVATPDGSIYVADTDNHVIRRIFNGMVTTFAGTGEAGYLDGTGDEAQFNKPAGIVVDPEGNLLVADMLNNKIRVIATDGSVTTMALTSLDSSHILFEPSDLAIGYNDVLYLVDSGNQCIKRIQNNAVTVLAGTWDGVQSDTYKDGGFIDGSNLEAAFNFPKSITSADGLVFVADTWNHSVRIIKEDDTVVTLIGDGSPGSGLQLEASSLNGPSGIAFNDGVLYISDRWNNRIVSLEMAYGSEAFDLDKEFPIKDDNQGIAVYYNDTSVAFDDVVPTLIEGMTYYPVRKIAEAIGSEVLYDEATRSVTLMYRNKSVIYHIDDEGTVILNGRLMLPMRQLASDLGVFLSINKGSNDVWMTEPPMTE